MTFWGSFDTGTTRVDGYLAMDDQHVGKLTGEIMDLTLACPVDGGNPRAYPVNATNRYRWCIKQIQ